MRNGLPHDGQQLRLQGARPIPVGRLVRGRLLWQRPHRRISSRGAPPAASRWCSNPPRRYATSFSTSIGPPPRPVEGARALSSKSLFDRFFEPGSVGVPSKRAMGRTVSRSGSMEAIVVANARRPETRRSQPGLSLPRRRESPSASTPSCRPGHWPRVGGRVGPGRSRPPTTGSRCCTPRRPADPWGPRPAVRPAERR